MPDPETTTNTPDTGGTDPADTAEPTGADTGADADTNPDTEAGTPETPEAGTETPEGEGDAEGSPLSRIADAFREKANRFMTMLRGERLPEEDDSEMSNMEMAKRGAKVGISVLATLGGYKGAWDGPAWFYQKFFTNPAERKRIKEALEEGIDEEDTASSPLEQKQLQIRAAIESSKFLSPEKKQKLFTKLRDAMTTHEGELVALDEERNEAIAQLLDKYITTRVKGTVALKESVNTALHAAADATGLGVALRLARAGTYGAVSLYERWNRVSEERDAEQRTEGQLKEFMKGFGETWDKLWLKGEGTKKEKALGFMSAAGTVGRFLGMGAIGVEAGLDTEAGQEFLNNMLDKFAGDSLPDAETTAEAITPEVAVADTGTEAATAEAADDIVADTESGTSIRLGESTFEASAELGDVSWDDGLITLERPDLQEGVFALRQNNTLVGSGRWTDGHIRIYRFDGSAFYDEAHPDSPLEITLNSPDHTPVTIELTPSAGTGVVFAGLVEDVHVGMSQWTPKFHNYGASAVSVSLSISSADGGYTAVLGDYSIPAGGTISTLSVETPLIRLVDREIVLNVDIGGLSSLVAIPVGVVAPDLSIQFDGHIRPQPEADFSLTLSGGFQGLDAAGTTTNITLSSAASFVTLTDVSGTAVIESDGSLTFSDASFAGSLTQAAHGSRLPLHFDFFLGDETEPFFQRNFMVIIGSENSSDPTPPQENDGYWAYDNTDTEYPEVPTYSWTDLSEESGAQHYSLNDDDHEIVSLPFTFKYYNTDYDVLTINSNGWASFGPDYINYFRNWSIPMPLGPDAMLAPFWDDLDNDTLVNGQEVGRPIHLFTYHDQTNGKFIVQWDEVWNGFGDRSFLETFQIVLYDPTVLAADDGNGVIEFQYFEVNDVDQINNFSTVGIESPDQNQGLMYVYARNYAPGAAVLEAGRIIRFTTNPPDLFWASVDDQMQNPTQFEVGSAYPNPFNGMTTIPFTLLESGDVSVEVYDLLGRQLISERVSSMTSGSHQYRLRTEGLSSGVYLVRIENSGLHHIQKVTLLK